MKERERESGKSGESNEIDERRKRKKERESKVGVMMRKREEFVER